MTPSRKISINKKQINGGGFEGQQTKAQHNHQFCPRERELISPLSNCNKFRLARTPCQNLKPKQQHEGRAQQPRKRKEEKKPRPKRNQVTKFSQPKTRSLSLLRHYFGCLCDSLYVYRSNLHLDREQHDQFVTSIPCNITILTILNRTPPSRNLRPAVTHACFGPSKDTHIHRSLKP